MQRSSLLLLMLTACQSAAPSAEIQDLLAQKKIDVERLDEIFWVEPDSLELEAPPLRPVNLATPTAPWFLVNRGSRVAWLYKSDLKVSNTFKSFLPPGDRFGGRETIVHTSGRPPAPIFSPTEWLLLQPGGRVVLTSPALDGAPGTYVLAVTIPKAGESLCWKARDFNAGGIVIRPRELHEPLLSERFEYLVLPPLASAGAPWHGTGSVDPESLGSGRFELVSDHFEAKSPPNPLKLEAYVLRESSEIIYRGPLRADSLESWSHALQDGTGRHILRCRTIYSLPFAATPGRYRLLVLAADAEHFFFFAPEPLFHLCDAPPGAYSRWVTFEID